MPQLHALTRILIAACFATIARAASAPGAAPLPSYQDFILAAGNAESDAVRLAHLKKLAHQTAVDGVTLPGLESLIKIVERWESPASRLDFFNNEIRRTVAFDFGVDAKSPLHPIAAFYLARMLVWTCLEHGDIYPFAEKRAEYLNKARANFEIAAKAFPENRIVRMYLGHSIPPEKVLPVPAGAPAWAVAQREALERLADIIEWWIDHRMRPNGEYGGGWGDDCEMWRSWVPVLFGFEHPRANWAQTFLSSQLLAQPHLAGGYHNRMNDVEHTAEDMSDALTPLMFLAPDNPEWARRVTRLVDLAETLWMGRNERGFLQFKSTYFTSDQIDLTPARACDTVYHPRALQPALLYWQRTGDARIGKLVTEWMRTWVDAAARTERGKPAGILPTAIHWPDGRIGGVGENWWQPENYPAPLYDFPSAMTLMLNTLALTAHLSGDKSFVAPLRTMAAARLEWIKAGRPDAAPGSRLWCAAQLTELGGAIAKYRFVTGDASMDELLRAESSAPYVQYRLLHGKREEPGMVAALELLASVVRVNFPAYTQEVRYTDRVTRFPVVYQPGWILEKGAPTHVLDAGMMALGLNRLSLLYNTATGDPGDPLYFPLNAVRWRTPPRDIAALVTDAGTNRFAARVYHFGGDERALGAELLLLKPGSYRVSVMSAGGKPAAERTVVNITSTMRTLPLKIPPHVEVEVVIEARR